MERRCTRRRYNFSSSGLWCGFKYYFADFSRCHGCGASIGTPATPGVGIVILSMVLKSVGIPTTGVALIIGVDRILDMCRTTVNVSGDLTASLVMNRWLGGQFEPDEKSELI